MTIAPPFLRVVRENIRDDGGLFVKSLADHDAPECAAPECVARECAAPECVNHVILPFGL